MANTTIRLKGSGVTGNVPTTLAPGELAINYTDGVLFYGNTTSSVHAVDVLAQPSGLDGDIQFNDLGLLGSDVGFSYNKTTNTLSVPTITLDGMNVGSTIAAAYNQANTATASANTKAPIASPTFTGTVSGITKAMVGLGNADNTTDAAKPISTATQTALNGKSDSGHVHSAATTTVSGFMSSTDKTKLDGIAAGATVYSHPTGDGNLHVPATGTTNTGKVLTAGSVAGTMTWESPAVTYTHPTNHPPSIITQDASNRFVTDAEKTTWNGKSDSGHVHSYLPLSGGTMTGTISLTSGGSGSNFAANHYSMGKDIADGSWTGPHYSDLIIGYHTGIRIGAAYSGVRFYNNSPTTDANNDGNGDGGEALLMTVGGHAGGTGVIAHNSMSAPIFYDSNDTAYYVDPNSTSRLNNLTVSGYITGRTQDSMYSVIQDTRASQLLPNDYTDYRTTYEFTDKIVSDWHSVITMQGWANGFAAWQIIGPSSSSTHENWYLRSGINSTWNPVRTILHSGNYTSYVGNGAFSVTAGTDLSGGGQLGTANQSGTTSVTMNHADITRTNTTSTTAPARNGTFTVVDSVTTNARGHVTGVNTKTVTLPDFEIVSISASLTLTTSWQDTTINAAELSTGSYIVQVESVSDYTVGGNQYQEYYTGFMSWFSGNTNSTGDDEITLHRAGLAPNSGAIFLRVQRTVDADVNDLKLQIAGTTNNSGAYTYNFKFRRMI